MRLTYHQNSVRVRTVLLRKWFSHQAIKPPENINQIVLLKYFASADDVRKKNIFIADNRQLACEVELSLTSEVSLRSVPGTDNDSAITVHLCRNGVPGMSGAYDNQTLARFLSYVYRPLCFVLNFFPVCGIVPSFALGN